MAHTTGPDGILNRNAWTLLTTAFLCCGLCACLIRLYPGLKLPAVAAMAVAGIAMITIAGVKTVKTR